MGGDHAAEGAGVGEVEGECILYAISLTRKVHIVARARACVRMRLETIPKEPMSSSSSVLRPPFTSVSDIPLLSTSP